MYQVDLPYFLESSWHGGPEPLKLHSSWCTRGSFFYIIL